MIKNANSSPRMPGRKMDAAPRLWRLSGRYSTYRTRAWKTDHFLQPFFQPAEVKEIDEQKESLD